MTWIWCAEGRYVHCNLLLNSADYKHYLKGRGALNSTASIYILNKYKGKKNVYLNSKEGVRWCMRGLGEGDFSCNPLCRTHTHSVKQENKQNRGREREKDSRLICRQQSDYFMQVIQHRGLTDFSQMQLNMGTCA